MAFWRKKQAKNAVKSVFYIHYFQKTLPVDKIPFGIPKMRVRSTNFFTSMKENEKKRPLEIIKTSHGGTTDAGVYSQSDFWQEIR